MSHTQHTPPVHGGFRIRVLVVDDDPEIAAALAETVQQHAQLALAGIAHDVATALAALRRPYDVVLVDLRLPDGHGIEIVREVARSETGRCIVISVFGDEANVIAAIEAGADGYLLKDSHDIANSILEVMRGGAPISPAIAAHLLRRFRAQPAPTAPVAAPSAAAGRPSLAPRELELLECLARGLSYREAAEQLSLSHHTVADYVKGIYRKLAVNSRGEAVFEAMQSGLIRIPQTLR
jgi:DNA-binding NarL/FixJ family response regulator